MTQRSGLALAVLALAVEAPMHPYRMQQLIRERGKDQVVNVGQRSQLYKTIDRLVRDGLLVARGVERDAARPERTIYAPTPAGVAAATSWTEQMLAAPRPEFGEFTAALAYLPLLTPAQAEQALRRRAQVVADQLDELSAGLRELGPRLPRLALIEDEYRIALLRTDLTWIEALIADLREDRLPAEFAAMRASAAHLPAEDDPQPGGRS